MTEFLQGTLLGFILALFLVGSFVTGWDIRLGGLDMCERKHDVYECEWVTKPKERTEQTNEPD